jgi:DNA topoisomerase-1|tara:strand:- start:1349 stop:3427 length:2079 start_codon:yes stop_codon:yes gene_type:complete
MPLVLIESPNKIPKLRKILGPNYTIMATIGHVMDLSKKNLGINLDTFESEYVVNVDKRDVVKQIKAEAKNHEVIYLATDPDREGEAIAAHIASKLPKRGKKFHRVLFNSITEDAVKKAMKNPTVINESLYEAQQARRITDRLVGFKVSPVMWNKGMRGTSAGRVQSVALNIISEREKEIRAFVPEEYWDIKADTDLGFLAELSSINSKPSKVRSKAEADAIVSDFNSSKSPINVSDYKKTSRTRKPAPPFITSTIQQAASNMFGWGAKKTMQVAQALFGHGLITYHRTDSVRSDPKKIQYARDLIKQDHGAKYLSPKLRVYGSKGSAQDAHEAIRPTYDGSQPSLSRDEKRLLNLIDSRFKASQMADAKFDQVSVKFVSQDTKKTYGLKCSGSTMTFDGFLKVYGETKDDVILPPMAVGQDVAWSKIIPKQHFTKPPNRYSDASLIKLLEKEGVGRPSTYASIIDTILDRGYVEREKKSLSATETGIMVSDFLGFSFPNIINTGFTAKMESNLDKIAEGKAEMKKVLKEFYDNLYSAIEKATKASLPDSFTVDVECPKCKSSMTKRISGHGPFLGCSEWPECNGTLPIDGKAKESESVETGHKCPECSNILIKRAGRNGDFYGCKSYPVCKFTAAIGENEEVVIKKKPAVKKTGVTCPKCKKNEMVERAGKYGKFYGCSGFPKCRNILKSLP